MPIPSPKKDEEKDKFLERCMADGVMNKEYKDTKQRYAVCIQSWKETKAKRKYPILGLMEK